MNRNLKRAATFLPVFAVCQWAFEGFAADAAILRSIVLQSLISTAVFVAIIALIDRMKRKTE